MSCVPSKKKRNSLKLGTATLPVCSRVPENVDGPFFTYDGENINLRELPNNSTGNRFMPTTHQQPFATIENSRFSGMENRHLSRLTRFVPHRTVRYVPGYSRGTYQVYHTLQLEAESKCEEIQAEEEAEAEQRKSMQQVPIPKAHEWIPPQQTFAANFSGSVASGLAGAQEKGGFQFRIISTSNLNSGSSTFGSTFLRRNVSLRSLKHP
eukprot:Nk52_evm7s324 gene=Nk52_evmTU7s324